VGRVSPHLANSLSGVKKLKSGNWQVSFYDKNGTRKYRTIVDEVGWTQSQAEKAGQKLVLDLKDVELTPRKNIFTPGEIDSIIDEALEDGRIPLERAEELKSFDPAERKRQIRTFSDEVDGKLVYKPLVPTSWGELQFEMDVKDKERIQARVRKKINAARNVSQVAYEELLGEMDFIKEAKNRSELAEWENRFNNKHAELVGDWKSIASGHLNKSPEKWAKENIKNHAKREFIRAGHNKHTADKMARDFVRGLSKADLIDWHNVLIPIKKYNDRVYKFALANDNPDSLKKLLAVHHIQPVGAGGTTFSPFNIVGVEGGQYKKGVGTVHANVHDPEYKSYYEGQQSKGITIGEHAPPGSGGSPIKILGPDGKLLDATEWVGGLEEGHTKPPAKFSIMNMKKLASFLPYGLGTFLGLGLAGVSDEGWTADKFKETVKDRSFWGDILLGLHSKKVASDPGRVSPWRIGATIAQDTLSEVAGLLRIDDPTEDDYVAAQQMGRKPDILTPQIYDDGKSTGIYGHPGIRNEIIKKRRPNIWT
tara:strand:- start:18 stop:1625 length:1608 start_codon:yes stop_codon:yes gene_type:complete